MKRLLLFLILTLALYLPVSAQAPTFNPRLIPVEFQAWWLPSYGHVHAAALVPLGQEVSGVVDVPIRVVMHDNPGKFHRFNLGDENDLITSITPGDLTCANPGVCAWSYVLHVDTRKEKNGWREWRIKAYINTPDGKQLINSSGVPVYVNNPNNGAVSNFDSPCGGRQIIGRGWYSNINYINSVFECVPTTAVSGTITVGFRAAGESSSHLTLELDKSHAIPSTGTWPEVQPSAGTVLFDSDGNFTKFQHILIDTRLLSNGWHTLAARSTSKATGMTGGTVNHSAGVAKYWFLVQN